MTVQYQTMNFRYENKKIKQGFTHIIGCDEVGRGCLAGPVVAAAVIFDPKVLHLKSYILNLQGVKDSKLITAAKREELSKKIKQHALAWSIAEVSSEEVDKINIHNASLLAMRKAVEKLLSANSHELAQESRTASIPEDLSASERLSGIQKQGLDTGYFHSPENSGMTPHRICVSAELLPHPSLVYVPIFNIVKALAWVVQSFYANIFYRVVHGVNIFGLVEEDNRDFCGN